MQNPRVSALCRMYKTKFSGESYLKVLPIFLALSMLKFRCRNCKIPAVLHNQNAFENPVCTFCNNNDTTDEFHVILKCSFFQDERKKKLLGKSVFEWANIYSLKSIMCSNDSKKLSGLNRFIRIVTSGYK